jgi:D-alanyl-D-alanine carboxypeptidase
VHPTTGIVQLDAVIDDDTLSFALDNGASYSFISDDVLTRLADSHPDWPRRNGALGCANIWGWWPGEPEWPILRIPTIEWGPVSLENVGIVGLPPFSPEGMTLGTWYSEKTARPVDGFLGPNAFEAFRVEIDYANSAIYFEKGEDTGSPEIGPTDMDMVGLTLRPETDGSYRVIGVASIYGEIPAEAGEPGMPGVEPGDLLIQIDSLEVQGRTMGTVIDALRGKPDEERTLLLERNGQRWRNVARVRRFLDGYSSRHEKTLGLSLRLQDLIEDLIETESEDPIHNVVLLVDSPRISWKGAAGMADGKSEPMTADHKFKIASIGKTFTATVILQLIEEGKLGLDDTLDRYLDDPVVRLDSLHLYEGISYGRRITIEQLLSHTSGIADYMEDERFFSDVLAEPTKQYDAAKILDWYYRYETNRKAVFAPGESFNYSDVNYVLLAMIIETVTGSTLHHQFKERIFDRLGMENSYLEHYEEPRGDNPLSHAFFRTWDAVTQVNTSFDWGGGGIVSTCEELVTFYRALLAGELFTKKETLRQMLEAADRGLGGTDYTYGLGIMKRSIHGLTFYGHGGAYDCDAYFCPEQNISVCMSLNQIMTYGKRDELLLAVVELVM